MSALTVFMDRITAFARWNRNGQQVIIGGGVNGGSYSVNAVDATAVVVCVKQADTTWVCGHTGAATEAATCTTALNP